MSVNEIIHNLSAMCLTATDWTRPTLKSAMSKLQELEYENHILRYRLEEMDEKYAQE